MEHRRDHLFLGWTLIGWVVALAMALRTVHTAEPQPVPEPRRVPPPAPAMAALEPSTNDATVTGIAKLADLRHEGLLTEEEYASAKARLLEQGTDAPTAT